MLDKKPLLLLLPNVLSETEEDTFCHFPADLYKKIGSLDGIIAESEKGARRYLKRFVFPEGKSFRDVPIRLLNEHTEVKQLNELLDPLFKGETWGIVSDAGLPCIADPGALLVSLARKKGIKVEAISGPSSVFLALMLSGLSAQKFCFQGYLERDPIKLRSDIKVLEKESKQKKMSQVFIEVPYRSQNLFEILLEVLEENTKLSVSVNLTAPDEISHTFSIREWRKKEKLDLHKKPVVFVFFSE